MPTDEDEAFDDAGWPGFAHVAPRGEGFSKEPFHAWFARVSSAIPHVPACVAEHWLYRNWGVSPYGWLPLAQLRFERQPWSNDQVLAVRSRLREEVWRGWATELGVDSARRKTPLGKYMLEHRTWPAPIVVLNNAGGLVSPDGDQLGRWHLLEGHMRSAYHLHLVTVGAARPTHEVWVATVTTLSD